MSSILAPRPDDRPPQHEDWSTGVTISLIAHMTLIGALVWGLHWRSSPVEATASAELWSAVPEAAAPPPVEAPPPPPPPVVETPPPPPPIETPKPPDIVTEQIKEKKPTPKPTPPPPPPPKPAPPKPVPAPPPPPPKLDAKALAKLHDENMKRMMGQMDAPANATGTAAHDSGPSASYAGRIIARLRPNVVLTDSVPGNPAVEVEIHCAPDGTIIGRRITKSSGSQAWDDAVLRAIDRTGTLPRDTNGKALDTIPIIWRPQD
jgi:colicin import membrane protein